MRDKRFTRLRCLLMVSLLLVLSACSPPATSLPATDTPAPPRTSPTLPATAQPTETALAVPSPTPTQQTITILPTTSEQQGAWTWKLRHPYADPTAPRLITAAADGYQLTSNFAVESIELSYRWIGIGDSVHKYQRIERRESAFWKNDEQVSSDAVDKLVQAVAHLRPEPQILSATVWTDDYPFWAVELTSVNGDKILLYSDSNTFSYIPWNVIYNGEIYSQYNGDIPIALDGLFTVFEGQTIAYTGEYHNEDFLPAVTFEAPPTQIREGFSGLLPVYNDFSYFIDPQKGELRGYLSGDSWADQVGDVEVNWLTGLQAIELFHYGGVVACSLENVPTDEPDWVYWRFSCPVGKPSEDTAYRFPIRLTYSTSTGQPYILSGELFGYWDTSAMIPVIAYPEEIGEILESSPMAGDLLRDHLIYVDNYFSYANSSTGVITREWDAEVVLLGQVQLGERIVPYTVKFDEVQIKDGKLVQWNINREKLEDLLKEVLGQTVTQRFLEYDPQGEIDLFYAENSEYPIIKSDDLPACAYLPQGKELPSPGQVLRGFSFNLSRTTLGSGFYDMQVVFMDHRLRIFQLDLHPASPGDAYWMAILPHALKPQEAPPFSAIWTNMGSPDITVEWNEQTNPLDVSYYETMFTGWNVVRLTEYMQGIRLNQKWLDLTPDGELILVDCQAS